MTGRVDGKVAFITGAARGQGRSHAVRLAQEGADIIALDVCKQLDNVPFPMPTSDDLAETADLVKAAGGRVVTIEADVRDFDAVKAGLDGAVEQLGKLDIVIANAGLANEGGALVEMREDLWDDMIGVNLTGVWKSVKAAIPHLQANGSGSIVLTSSVGGLKAYPNVGHYVAAKHGIVGLMRTFAVELGHQNIRCNSVHPTHVSTDMLLNEGTYKLFRPDLENPGPDDMKPICEMFHVLPTPWVDSVDVSNAVLYLVSDEARFITGVPLPVDAGSMLK
ncbi:mycofactocin-coupled SDR family oxidoreductase [Nocardia asteroides]|uniref:mycofactocin-coupled SDR family oxidoreductase n=1 Tax=Nocardia asteroides TaxID=1824 RepID=UPI001E4DAFEB|nr:mycofactocin-coupled SDR family oxidoreductase [Nocardia asteroides]UGT61290.1 mycofactocin-coupled SDR family oxidoreductase [Nocardia asteroides]